MTQKTLICLGGGLEAVPIIERANALGCMTVVVDMDGRCPARYISDIYVQESCYHSAGAIEALHEISVEAEVTYDGVLCCAVDAPLVAAEIAAEFGLPGLSVEAAKLGQNKWEQGKILNDAKIPSPWCEIIKWPGIKSGNFVVKPVDSRGGRGVVRLLPDTDPAFAYEIAKANSPTGHVMVEEWLDGSQLSTESIIQDGKVLFTAIGLRNYDRLYEFAPFVIEDGFDEPYTASSFYWSYIEGCISPLIERAARALDWYQHGAGTIKGDLVIHAGLAYIIELAPRLSGGFFSTHGHPLAYGVPFVDYAIRAALGEVLDKPQPTTGNFVSQRYVFPDKADIGKTVKDIKNSELDGFTTYNIHIGQVIEPVTSHPRRWGQVLATGRMPYEAKLRAEQTVKRMKEAVILE